MEEDFSPQEKKALERLERAQQQWPLVRWMQALLGMSNIFAGFRSYHAHGEETLGVLLGLLGLACLLIAIVNWHGFASRMLLLKMVRDRYPKQDQPIQPEAT